MSGKYMPWSWGVRYQYEQVDDWGELNDYSIEEETIFDNYKESWEYFNEKVAEQNIARVVLVVYRNNTNEESIICAYSREWEDNIKVSWE